MLRPTSNSLHQSAQQFTAVFDAWTNQQTSNCDNVRAAHTEAVKATKARMSSAEREISSLENTLAKKQQDVSIQKQNIRQTQTTLAETQAQRDILPKQLASLKMQAEQTQRTLTAKQKRVEQLDKEMRDKLDQLQKGIHYYSDRLGLDFEQSGGIFFMKFHLIDPANLEAYYSIGLVIDPDSYQYRVLNCNPPIDNMEELIQRLNLTEDFSRFVQSVRARFVEIAREGKITSVVRAAAGAVRPSLGAFFAAAPALNSNTISGQVGEDEGETFGLEDCHIDGSGQAVQGEGETAFYY
eukprot:gb/GEZN01009964.1/.p1 GENE.gb/GEZN01009964.1/~~gb/GEZN01009964.1/.p1  ORF type:complete len:296 (-),score=52.34 gb/GEZN01009964.1/:358-1245(-)